MRLNVRWDTALRDFQIQLEPRVSRREAAASHDAPRDDGSPAPCGTGLFEPTKKDLMTSKITSRSACLAELTSNPKSFYNCPDLHGGSGLPEGARSWERAAETLKIEMLERLRHLKQQTQPQQPIY